MLAILFRALFFFAPAGIANMMPVFAAKIPGLKRFNYPIDFFKTYKGKRIFGEHKTIRGFISGYFGALFTLLLLIPWYNSSPWIQSEIAYVDYNTINIWLWALIFDIGVLGGDAIKSFFKRQLNRPPGSTWFPFDQIDYVLGGILASLVLIQLPFLDYLVIAVVYFLFHPLVTALAYIFKLKDSPI